MPPHILKVGKVEKPFQAEQFMCFVKIDHTCSDDQALIDHELCHVSHWWLVTLSALIAWLSAQYFVDSFAGSGFDVMSACAIPFFYHILCKIDFVRLHVEIDCYRKQLEHYKSKDIPADIFASRLIELYGLKYEHKEIKKRLLA